MNKWKMALAEALGRIRALELGEGAFLVGSDPSADVCIPLSDVAPQHLQLRLGAGRVVVDVLEGAPQVRINGSLLEGRGEFVGAVRIELCGASLELAPLASDSSGATRVIRHSNLLSQQLEVACGDAAVEQTLRIRLPERRGEAGGETLLIEILQGSQDARLAWGEDERASGGSSETAVFQVAQATVEAGRSAEAHSGYQLETEIARGGMGRIFEARDSTLRRRVAVKVSSVTGGGDDEQFRMEAEVLAHLAHPNIVPVHASGKTETGRPFYAMKLVEGKTLKMILRELAAREPSALRHYTRERLLNVFRKVCDAVGFAHAEGYLHRDLKPENVMVGEFGEVLVMDWGLARRVSGRGEVGGIPEAVAAVQYIEGTPQYMSPEQAEGLALDERSDIYALGGILFSILTLRPPVEGSSVEEVLEKVKRCEVSAITTKRVAPGVKGAPVLESGRVPEALRAITLKAMACAKNARYAHVSDLVADIESYQNGFATSAEEAGLGRQLVLLMKRHRAASVLLFALLLSGGGFTARLAQSERQARSHAREAQDNARKAERSAHEALENARVAKANQQRAENEKEKERRTASEAQIALAEAAESDANGEEMLRVLEKVPEDLRGQEWQYLWKRAESSDLTIEAKGGAAWVAWAAHPLKAGVLVALQSDGSICSVDLGTGEQEDLLKKGTIRGLFENTLSLSQDAKRVAVILKQAEPNQAGLFFTSEVYDLTKGTRLFQSPRVKEHGVATAVLSPDGSLLLLYFETATSRLEMMEVASGKLLWSRPMEGFNTRIAAFFTESSKLQVYSHNEGVLQLASRTGELIGTANQFPMLRTPFHSWQIAAANQGRFLAVATYGTCNISSDAGVHTQSFKLPDPDARIASIDQGKTLVTLCAKADRSRVLQFWDAADVSLNRTLPVSMVGSGGVGRSDWALFAHPASGHVAVIRGARMRVWKSLRGERIPEKQNWESPVGFLGASSELLTWPQIKSLDVARSHYFMRILDASAKAGVAPNSVSAVADSQLSYLSLSQNGNRFAMLTWPRLGGPNAHIFTRTPGGVFERTFSGPLPYRPWPEQFNLSPSGGLLWMGAGMVNTENGKSDQEMNRQLINVPPFARCSPVWLDDSTVLEVAFLDSDAGLKKHGVEGRALVLWKADQAEPALVVSAPDACALALSPDGTRIAEGGRDMRVRIRDARTLDVLQSLRVHDAPLTGMAWHPSLPLLATCSEDCTMKIWDLRSETLLDHFGYFEKPAERALWSPDGQKLCAVFKSSASPASIVYRPKELQPEGKEPAPPATSAGGK